MDYRLIRFVTPRQCTTLLSNLFFLRCLFEILEKKTT